MIPVRLILAALVLGLGVFAAVPASATPPNIVLFLVDDLGWQDTSVPFHTAVSELNHRYRTPNMERLAASGVVFTSAYAHPICSPTRVSLMTGLSPARHRVTNWTLRRDASSDRAHPTLAFPAWNLNGLSPEPGVDRTLHSRALPSYLHDAGYRTIHIGKAHFGAIGTPGADPRSLGFDVNIAGHAAGAPGSYHGRHDYSGKKRSGGGGVWDVPGLEAYHGTDVNLTDALAREAVREIDEAVAAGPPFFLYLSHYAVHTPIMADARFLGGYPDLPPVEAKYASMVEAMDASLGVVLDTLERHDIAERTVILFMSDNGGLSATGRAGEKHTHNRPLSSGKGSLHEGGIRVPLIVRWPSVGTPGSRADEPVLVEDLFATVLEISGMPRDQRDAIAHDGVSLGTGRWTGRRDEEPGALRSDRVLVWHLPNFWGFSGPGLGPASAIRVGAWKLVYYHDPQDTRRFELFDLEADLGETTNLVRTRPDESRRLAGAMQRTLLARHAQWPTVQATGEGVRLPVEALEAFYASGG